MIITEAILSAAMLDKPDEERIRPLIEELEKKCAEYHKALQKEGFEGQWYETAMLTPDSAKTILLAWISGGELQAMRTGMWSNAQQEYRGSGNAKFQTQPSYWRDLPQVR